MAAKRSVARTGRKRKSAKRIAHDPAFISKSDARRSVKVAKRVLAHRSKTLPASWQRGGREWLRVLGHFGAGGE